MQDQAAAEAVAAAATSEFEQVAARNEHDMTGFAARQAADIQQLLLAWVDAAAVHADVEADAWLEACRQLGADAAQVDAIARM